MREKEKAGNNGTERGEGKKPPPIITTVKTTKQQDGTT
jgi:hypothetical protein